MKTTVLDKDRSVYLPQGRGVMKVVGFLSLPMELDQRQSEES